MGHLDWCLPLTGKCGEDGAILFAGLTIPKCCRNNIFAEASDCMALEVRRCPTILRVLIAAYSVNAIVAATRGSALEKVELVAVIVADSDLGLEELIYWRPPTFLEACWDKSLDDDGMRRRWVHKPIFCSSVSALSSEATVQTASSSVSAMD
jgi:hypothetical protein